MEGIANFISMLDYVLDTKRKRHITGGLLLSGALLFGGLATRSCESTIYSGSSNRFIFTTTGETGTESSRSRGLRG